MAAPSANGSLRGLRELNRLRVVETLRRRGSASRTDLARLTGLSRTTVASLVTDLQASGLVVERPEPDGQAVGRGRGRRPGMLRLDASAGNALGIDFGHRQIRVAVADLAASVLAERRLDFDVDNDADLALDAAVEAADALLAEAKVDRDQVVGVGVGLAGPVDRRTGTVGSSSILPGWLGVDAGLELETRLGLPVAVENDANLGALAEASFGAGRGVSDLVYVMLSAGIGAGLVLGDRLYRGSIGLAGELGHVSARPDGQICRCGNRGCLETLASTCALIELLRPAQGERLTLQGLLELSAGGDLGARRAIRDAGHAVGRALADLCNCLNPAVIVVGGELSVAGEPLHAGIREALDRHAQPRVAEAVELRPAVLGARAEVLGALALVIGDSERLSSAGLAALRQPGAIPVVT